MRTKSFVGLIFLMILLGSCASNTNRREQEERRRERERELDRTIAYYTERIRLDPNDATAFNNRGVSHSSRGNHAAAMADYNSAIRLNPNSSILFTNRGDAHRRSDNIRAAIADYEAALRIDPNNARARQSLQELRGLGSIRVTSEFRTHREETRTHQHYVPGTYFISGSRGPVVISPGRIETETYTVRVPVTGDSNLPFIILRDGREVFRGATPITVTNFEPGVTYTIIWTARNGARREGTVAIPTARPFRRNIQID